MLCVSDTELQNARSTVTAFERTEVDDNGCGILQAKSPLTMTCGDGVDEGVRDKVMQLPKEKRRSFLWAL